MEPTQKPATRSLSRVVVSTVVGLLIVIAIVGIVLAGRRGASTTDATSPSPTAGVVGAPPAGGPAASPASDPLPTSVRFAGTTEKLAPDATGEVARLADALRAGGQQVGVTARFMAGNDKPAALELARKRVEAVQHALQSNGISGSRIQAEMIEVPPGSQPADAVGRVQFTVR